MKQQYTKPPGKGWGSMAVFSALLLLAHFTRGQEGSQGNTTIFGGAQMTFFSNHNFVTGGGGAQPGVILTERASGNFGVLNFAGDNLTSTGASDAGYVDGYVRKYGAGTFVFPVGDNGALGQFAASADGVMGAYFHSDPNTAVTSNLFTGADYAALPNGGPFPTSSIGTNVEVVSTIEYWDIDGSNATPLTLTWDAGSGISALTGGQLNKLTIAGWNGTEWVAVPSKIDTTSVLGGTTDLTAGSITTISPLAPDTYTAYTFASLVVPMPVTLIGFTAVAENNTVLLNWSTAEETNSDRFEIEHSRNGKNWSPIGTVKSRGESAVRVDYSFVHKNPTVGNNYYRLKAVDSDDTFAYSSIRKLYLDADAKLVAYPNPTSDKLLIRNYQLVKKLVLRNALGVNVLEKSGVSSDGLDLSGFRDGVYTVTMTLFDGTISTHQIAVIR